MLMLLTICRQQQAEVHVRQQTAFFCIKPSPSLSIDERGMEHGIPLPERPTRPNQTVALPC